MKIATEYYGNVKVLRKYEPLQIRHGDQRQHSRRTMIISLEHDRRHLSDRRFSLERRSMIHEPWGIIYVYGSNN